MTTLPDATDPILAEIHNARRNLLEKHGGISGLAAFLREQETASQLGTVNPIETASDLSQTRQLGRHPRVSVKRDQS